MLGRRRLWLARGAPLTSVPSRWRGLHPSARARIVSEARWQRPTWPSLLSIGAMHVLDASDLRADGASCPSGPMTLAFLSLAAFGSRGQCSARCPLCRRRSCRWLCGSGILCCRYPQLARRAVLGAGALCAGDESPRRLGGARRLGARRLPARAVRVLGDGALHASSASRLGDSESPASPAAAALRPACSALALSSGRKPLQRLGGSGALFRRRLGPRGARCSTPVISARA